MMTPSYAGVSVGYSSGSRSFADPRDRGFEISLTSMVMVQDTTADSLSFLEAASVGTDERAYNIGLVNRVVPLDQLMPTALELAETISQNGPLAGQTAKEIAVRALGIHLELGWKEAALAALLNLLFLYPICLGYRALKAAHPHSLLRYI